MALRYLPRSVLQSLGVPTAAVIASIEGLIRDRAAGKMWAAPKSVLTPPDGRYVMSTLSIGGDPPLLAVKSLMLNPRNAARGLPSINSLVTVLDGDTGEPMALLDGNWLTEVRTAGLSATAARFMARPDSAVIAFAGSGAQARSHLNAFAELFPLKSVRISGRGRANIEELVKLASSLGLTSEICDTPQEAIRNSDIVVTSLTRDPDRAPFLDARSLAAGSFAAIVDLAEPWMADPLSAFDRIVIDDLEQEAALPVKLAPPELVLGDLGGLVLGRIKGREKPEERTAFIFRGLALGDLALAIVACRKAQEAGAGTVIEG